METSTSSIPRPVFAGASDIDCHLQLQLEIVAEVLRADPDVLTLQALADRELANPRSLTGGIALARALRELDNEGLVISDATCRN